MAGKAVQGRAGQGRSVQGRAGGRAGQVAVAKGIWEPVACLDGSGSLESANLGPQTPFKVRSMAGLGQYSPRMPGGFTLPRPRSEPRAPMQMVSGALGS